MPPAAAVGGGMALSAATGAIGAGMQSRAANAAAEQQQWAAGKANEMQTQMYDQTKSNEQPWMNAGLSALAGMQNPDFQRDFSAQDFKTDPGYDFRLSQGQQALDRSAAAKGGLLSGAQLKASSQYNQDFASNEYNNAYNRFNNDRNQRFGRLSSIAGMGQNATGQLVGAGENYANQYGQNLMGGANAAASAKLYGAKAWSNALSGIGQTGMQGAGMLAG